MSFGATGWLGDDPQQDSQVVLDRKAKFRSDRDKYPERTAQLAPKGPIAPHEPDLWRAISYVKKGRYADVSLWEYNEGPRNAGRLAILKTENEDGVGPVYGPRHDQTEEGLIMERLIKERRTDHLVNMVYRGSDYHKLYLEYCVESDLQEVLEARQREKEYFTEEQLWRMFLCLAKGSRSLGGEHLRPADGTASAIIHFDLKPENIFLGDADKVLTPNLEYHTCLGGLNILKIGDFGDAWPLVDDPKLTQGELIQGWGGEDVEDILPGEKKGIFKEACIIRDRGTIGYHPPEQRLLMERNPEFSLAWEQWFDWEANYKYSAKTNIWGIGIIMWQLICLSDESPLVVENAIDNNRFRYTVDWESGVRRKPERTTYGPEITKPEVKARYPSHNYLLINLVLMCLMEYPRHRPTNEGLLNLVQQVCNDYDAKLLNPDQDSEEEKPNNDPPDNDPPKAPLPDIIESSTLPLHRNGAMRFWTRIPNIFTKQSPFFSTSSSPPVSPNTRPPNGFRPYGPPPTPSPNSRREPKTPPPITASILKHHERVRSPRNSPPPQNNGSAGNGPISYLTRPFRRKRVYWGCLCLPCCFWNCSNALWIVVLALSIWSTGFCLFYSMLVEYESHL